MAQGFQWVDGSFLEDVERTEDRSPEDIDVVTFYWDPDPDFTSKLVAAFPDIANRATVKAAFFVDHFPIDIGFDPETTVEATDIGAVSFPTRVQACGKGCSELTSTPPSTILQRWRYSRPDHDQPRK
jgi:hypothetical protein